MKTILKGTIYVCVVVILVWFMLNKDIRQLCEGMKADGGTYTSHEIVECGLVGINL